jgi:hypothetical protein
MAAAVECLGCRGICSVYSSSGGSTQCWTSRPEVLMRWCAAPRAAWTSSSSSGGRHNRARGARGPRTCRPDRPSIIQRTQARCIIRGPARWRPTACRASYQNIALDPKQDIMSEIRLGAPAVWPREAVRALSGQPKGSCRGFRPSGGTAGDRGRPHGRQPQRHRAH